MSIRSRPRCSFKTHYSYTLLKYLVNALIILTCNNFFLRTVPLRLACYNTASSRPPDTARPSRPHPGTLEDIPPGPPPPPPNRQTPPPPPPHTTPPRHSPPSICLNKLPAQNHTHELIIITNHHHNQGQAATTKKHPELVS